MNSTLTALEECSRSGLMRLAQELQATVRMHHLRFYAYERLITAAWGNETLQRGLLLDLVLKLHETRLHRAAVHPCVLGDHRRLDRWHHHLNCRLIERAKALDSHAD